MSLNDYLDKLINQGFLKREDIGFDQIRALLESARKNLSAARKNLTIDEETCYTMAYRAMLKVARALLFLHGLRPEDGQQHKTTVEITGKILSKDFNNLIDGFDKMRKKRNKFTYDPLIPLSQSEANSALETAEEFCKKVETFLKQINPQLELFKE